MDWESLDLEELLEECYEAEKIKKIECDKDFWLEEARARNIPIIDVLLAAVYIHWEKTYDDGPLAPLNNTITSLLEIDNIVNMQGNLLESSLAWYPGSYMVNDDGEDTVLMIASFLGYTALVETVLSGKNIDVNLQNSQGETALMLATNSFAGVSGGSNTDDKNNRLVIVNRLLDQKEIDLNLQDYYGMTALDFGVETADINIVNALLNTKKKTLSIFRPVTERLRSY